ncbi:hypothetical protein BRARA_H00801 [Brassica rapa]|uniref:Uncharacterized protein n=1 Tax=Brassica campestris TaxID=3711 RepID=A0A397Y9A2_BRACM|nr:hypothetical protein BRARA_H00801 [Brassica rapa]
MKKKQSKSGPSVPETNRGRDRVSFMISSSIGSFSVGDQNHAILNPSASQSEIKPCNSEAKNFTVGLFV